MVSDVRNTEDPIPTVVPELVPYTPSINLKNLSAYRIQFELARLAAGPTVDTLVGLHALIDNLRRMKWST